MKPFPGTIVTFLAVLLVSGCDGDVTAPPVFALQASVQRGTVATLPVADTALEPIGKAIVEEASRTPPFDGRWACSADDGQRQALTLDIAGNVLREAISEKTMSLSYDKGIQLGSQLADYRDVDSGQRMHARTMTQVDKPGFASMFSAAVNGGAGAGVEFSLNPNDTLKISDYSSMTGADSVGGMVPMTCRREHA